MAATQSKNTRQPSIFIAVTSLGLALASMKQLKFLGGLVGPGELILLISTSWTILSQGTIKLGPIKLISTPLFMIAVIATIITFSTIVNIGFLGRSGANYSSDMISVWASIFIVIAIAASSDSVKTLALILCWSAMFTVLLSGALFGYSLITGSSNFAGMPLYYWGTRFQGLSPDPNQLARVCASAPFLSLIAMNGAARYTRYICWGALITSVIVGIETESQSCWLAWSAGVLAIIAKFLLFPQKAQNRKVAQISFRFLGIIAATAATLAVLVAVLPALFGEQSGLSVIDYLAATGGSDRTHVAELSLAQIASHPVLGLGFGQHITWATMYAGTYVIESHNAFLDIAVRGGLPALLIFLGVSIMSFLGALRTRSSALVAALIATVIFGMGITPLRQPTYWLILAMTAGVASSQQRGRQARDPLSRWLAGPN